jgi:cation/acetate symporter
VFVGLGGILVCSFLGGMRAVTWTQVAQYIILIIAYLTPVVWLGVKHTGIPIPQIAYGVRRCRRSASSRRRSPPIRRRWKPASWRRSPRTKARAATKDMPKATAERKALLEKKLAEAKSTQQPDYV